VTNFGFNNVHFTSVMAISLVCIYLIVRDRATIPAFKCVCVVFAGAGIHEWLLYAWGWFILKSPIVAWQDAAWFATFIVLGVAFANKRQRIVLLGLATYLSVLMCVYVGFFHDSDVEIGVYTVQTISDNFIEVFSWVTTALGFLFA
jgi:hypothetical protein